MHNDAACRTSVAGEEVLHDAAFANLKKKQKKTSSKTFSILPFE